MFLHGLIQEGQLLAMFVFARGEKKILITGQVAGESLRSTWLRNFSISSSEFHDAIHPSFTFFPWHTEYIWKCT